MSSSIEKAMKRKAQQSSTHNSEKAKVKSTEIQKEDLTEQKADIKAHDTGAGLGIQAETTESSQNEVGVEPKVPDVSVEQPEELLESEKETNTLPDNLVETDIQLTSSQTVKDNELFIDLSRLEEQGYVALSEKRTLINEEYRSIKRKLLNNAFGPISKTLKHSNLILVSSSKPNEGKTFTSVNLALSIALEQDKTVLLVDSDVLKPSVSKSLDIGEKVGLIEYLLGEEEDVSKIIYRTNVENLRILPAGLPHHLSNELLSSQKMITLIEEFATRYPDRVVVFDAPPLLGVNETSVMAEQCGQGVVVVEEHKSKLADVQKAVELLPEEMAVGFVVNKSTTQDNEHGYGYGYGYYYGAKKPEK